MHDSNLTTGHGLMSSRLSERSIIATDCSFQYQNRLYLLYCSLGRLLLFSNFNYSSPRPSYPSRPRSCLSRQYIPSTTTLLRNLGRNPHVTYFHSIVFKTANSFSLPRLPCLGELRRIPAMTSTAVSAARLNGRNDAMHLHHATPTSAQSRDSLVQPKQKKIRGLGSVPTFWNIYTVESLVDLHFDGVLQQRALALVAHRVQR